MDLLCALHARYAPDVEDALVPDISEQNTKFSASRQQRQGEKKMATNAFFERIN